LLLQLQRLLWREKPEVVAEEEGFLRQRQYQWRVQSTIQIVKLVSNNPLTPPQRRGITPSYFGVKVPLLQRDLGKLGI
jgi:hypothetical protein